MKKVLFALFFVVGLAYFTPPSVFNLVFKEAEVPLLIKNEAGTIWSGECELFFSPPANSTKKPFRILERLSWEVSFSDIFSKGVVVVLKSNNFKGDVSITLSLGKISVSKLQFFSNTELLGYLGEPLHTLALQGVIMLESNGMTFSADSISGEAIAHFDLISSRLVPNVNVLGNYDLRLKGVGKQLSVELLSRDAVVMLRGSGSIDLSRRHIVFRGSAEAAPQAPLAVQKILYLVGNGVGSRSTFGGNFSW